MKSDEAYKNGRSFFKQTYHICCLCLKYSDTPDNRWISDLEKDTAKANMIRELLTSSRVRPK
jgi:hypothetical protein